MIYACCDENRRAAVLGNPTLNGIDYLEVLDRSAPPGSPRQQTLLVYCIKPAPTNLTPGNVLIIGGESITGIRTLWIAPASPAPTQASPAEATYFAMLVDPANVLVIRTSEAGDFSPYALRLVNDSSQASVETFDVTEALTGFDPQLAEATFSFKVECDLGFDCKPPQTICQPQLPTPPPINYLAKDYGSFRTIMLDRLNQLLPTWQGSTEADIGVALAEIIAYVTDGLSYHQDAVTTESYLLTARSRISLRRHALLVDYTVHDGCNARAWICLTVQAQVFLDQKKTRFYTYAPEMPSSLAIGSGNEQAALDAGTVAFEPMQDANLFPEHNQMQFYTWGDTNCCLPQGATEATLLGSYPNLQVGDVLIFVEMMGPQTGVAADADIRHRYAVRLTAVATQDAAGNPLVDPLFEAGTGAPITSSSQKPTPVTEIRWTADDALPFPLCISSTLTDPIKGKTVLTGVSTVFGNVVLADQGLSMPRVALPAVPEPTLFRIAPLSDHCNQAQSAPLPVRYRPQILESPITQAVPLPIAGSPVTANPIPLLPNDFVSLEDANGFTSAMVRPDAPSSWPQYFGVLAAQNSGNKSNFDLSVVFAPAGGPAGMTGAVTLETFANLTLEDPTADNYAVTQLNTLSRFVNVPPTYAPPATNPTQFASGPTMLVNNGTVPLKDASNSTYLTVGATNPLSWPPNFAVLAQGYLQDPKTFNILLIYQPASGAVGVNIPVVVEQFTKLDLSSIAGAIADASDLISVITFEEGPNPTLSAFDLMHYDARQALPSIKLRIVPRIGDSTWLPALNLLASAPSDHNFVVEIEYDGTAYLRFGDNNNGASPDAGTKFHAAYRIGNGTAGNVGAGTLIFLAGDPRITACINPMAAGGGVDPETNEQIRRRAPQAFLTQERAITMGDYAIVTEAASSQVEDAAASLRWTGSWYTVFIAAEPQGGADLSTSLQKNVAQYVNRYRLAGQDLKVEGPDYVPLEIELTVCVQPNYLQGNVEQSVNKALSEVFAPGKFTFGQTAYLSPIYAAVRSVAGVRTVTATVFQPQGVSTHQYLRGGEIPMGPFQVARMDNDPNFPNHGQLVLTMMGGR
ncbi:MAG: putative baseplate assembly protein [Candidatus Cybelea sp.]